MFIDFPLDCTKNSLENVTEIIKSNKDEIEKLLKIEKKTYLNFMRPLMELECRLNDYFTFLLSSVLSENKNKAGKALLLM